MIKLTVRNKARDTFEWEGELKELQAFRAAFEAAAKALHIDPDEAAAEAADLGQCGDGLGLMATIYDAISGDFLNKRRSFAKGLSGIIIEVDGFEVNVQVERWERFELLEAL